ncbi:hypothetical protein [Clostridiisalibacter paucivorans]|uniref:hypothetical protein n=1 Tax=Clostridiisalibacter paucivorans TaxID=408753 RepID=UPI000478C2A6|nr:hypothetical protein [Clostridiisalibacter paucivorans]
MNKNFLKGLVTTAMLATLVIGTISISEAEENKDLNKSDFSIGEKIIVEEYDIKDNYYIIDYKKGDVTGDDKEDDILLVGHKINGKEDIFADDLTVLVKDSDDGFKKATYKDFAGYSGNLFVGDFTGDKIDDVMVSADTGGSGGIIEHMIAVFTEENSKVIFDNEDNEGLQIKAKFEDDFKAEVEIEELKKTIKLDISAGKDDYIEQGIYDDSGELLQKIEPWMNPISLAEPVYNPIEEKYELRAYQRIVGSCNADTISYMEERWSYNDEDWDLTELKYHTYIVK